MSSPVRLQRPRNLTLDASKAKSRVTFKDDSISTQTNSSSNTNSSPKKPIRYEADFRTKRKRANSCSFSWDHLNNKRRKAAGAIILPTKFLLGGNITDPLNLEALDKGDGKKTSEEAMSGGCKRGGTVRVIIPPNINDPLNLDACSEDGEEQLADAISRQRRRRKARKRKRRNSEPGGMTYESEVEKTEADSRLCTSLDDTNTPSRTRPIQPATSPSTSPLKEEAAAPTVIAASPPQQLPPTIASTDTTTTTTTLTTPLLLRTVSDPGLEIVQQESSPPPTAPPQPSSASASATSTPLPPNRPSTQKRARGKPENKIVSPVVPQPGVERKRHLSHQRSLSTDKSSSSNQSHLLPPKHFHPKNSFFQYGNYNQYYGYRNMGHKIDPRLKFLKKEWFCGMEVLDIGCNIGHITFSIGRDFAPQRIVGIDIDKKLVNIAQKNVKHYLVDARDAEEEFPKSMKLLYGPLKPPVDKAGQKKFPYNIKFCQSNYVLENDALLETVRPEFDTVLCLSVTKWIHLNWGDAGLKRFFRRIFRNLKPGGRLILEPQAWPSYNKKRKLTSEIFENYKSIRLFPNKFGEFLTSDVGFQFVKKGSVYQHYSRGFDRPIYIYKKPSLVKSPVEDSCKARGDAKTESENLPSDASAPLEAAVEAPPPSSAKEDPKKGLESSLNPAAAEEATQVESQTSNVEESPSSHLRPPTTDVQLPSESSKSPLLDSALSLSANKVSESPAGDAFNTASTKADPQASSSPINPLPVADLSKSPSADCPKIASVDLPKFPSADLPEIPEADLPAADPPKLSAADSLKSPSATLPSSQSEELKETCVPDHSTTEQSLSVVSKESEPNMSVKQVPNAT